MKSQICRRRRSAFLYQGQSINENKMKTYPLSSGFWSQTNAETRRKTNTHNVLQWCEDANENDEPLPNKGEFEPRTAEQSRQPSRIDDRVDVKSSANQNDHGHQTNLSKKLSVLGLNLFMA
jgi:hypothetical protein